MPMFFVRRKPNNIAWPDFFNTSAFALGPAETGGDNQRLAERMRMPGGARTRLERHSRATHARWVRRFK